MDYKNDENYKELTNRCSALNEVASRLIRFRNMLLIGQEVDGNLISKLDDIINDLMDESIKFAIYAKLTDDNCRN